MSDKNDSQKMHERMLERLLGAFNAETCEFQENELDVEAAIEIAKLRAVDVMGMLEFNPHPEDWIINNPMHTSFMFWRGYSIGLRESRKLSNKKPPEGGLV